MDQSSENALVVIGPQKSKLQTNSADQPLPLDEQTIDAEAKTITIDLTAFDSRMDSGGSDHTAKQTSDRAARWYHATPLAASIGLATLLGVMAGTAATVALMPDKTAAAPTAVAQADETRALQEQVTQLSSEVVALKA